MKLELDGAQGEGGGQILRSALALSLLTGTAFSVKRIRAGRSRPGLLRQHLACVQAAADISCAKVEGATLGSQNLDFAPGAVRPGEYRWSIGSAGSTSLVLQTVLLPLSQCGGKSRVQIEGGTHNSMSPPFEFLDLGFRPLLERMGHGLSLSKPRTGFFPAGGGVLEAAVAGRARHPVPPLDLRGRGLRGMEVHAWSANIPARIGKAEVDLVGAELGIGPDHRHAWMVDSPGPGNAVAVIVELEEGGKRVFTSFGERGLALERVAASCAAQVKRFLASGASVDEHLQDQLLLPMSLGAGGRFTTTEPSLHARTNMDVIRSFLDVDFGLRQLGPDLWDITVETERNSP